MNNFRYIVILVTVIFILYLAPLSTDALAIQTTILTLDPIPSQVSEGDEVTFTGSLRTSNDVALSNMTVSIVEQRATEAVILAKTTTDENGKYEAIWTAQFTDYSKEKVRLMTMSAVFDGDDGYSASKSSIVKLRIVIKNWIVIFSADRETYTIDEVATFTIKFYDRFSPIDPDSITAEYDGIVVNMTRLSEGVYIYQPAELTPKFHRLEIAAEKHGFEPFNGAKTITVLERQRSIELADEDFIAPKSDVIIDGLHNNQTNWYYGKFPVAIFNATDQHFGSPSGVFHIVVLYMSKLGDERCTKNAVCYLQPNENMTLSRYNSVNHGQILLRWFAKDYAGNIEKPANKLSFYVDTVPPNITVMNISTESKESIPTGANCNKYKVEERDLQCVIVRAYTTETITFQILVDDLISGVNSTYYRVIPYSTVMNSEWQTLETESKPFPHSISFKIPELGTYRLQMKAKDVAGNESPVKEFIIRVTKQPSKGFLLSIEDFDVSRQIDATGNIYYDISALVKNETDEAVSGKAIVLIQQRNGMTEHIETMNIWISGNGESNVSMQWKPERIDAYKVKVFILDNGSEPLTAPAVYDPTL